MENITTIFNETYAPVKALVIHQSQQNAEHVYVEAYDISSNGKPVNAHPLSVKETIALADSLNASSELKNDYLKSKGLLPDKVLYILLQHMVLQYGTHPHRKLMYCSRKALKYPAVRLAYHP